MHNCRAFDKEAGTTATGSSGLSESSGEKGDPGRDGSVWALTLGQRGLAPAFLKGPWWSVGMFPLNRIKFPQALFEATK